MKLTVDCALKAPLAVSDISAAWLTEALATQYPGVKVVTSQTAEELWGMAGKVRVALTYNEVGRQANLPATLIVKAGFGRYPANMEWTYIVEVWAYRHALRDLDTNAPGCYFAGVDPDGRAVMILEDLRPRKVAFCQLLEPLNYAQSARFLDAFARVHARWWDSPELAEGGQMGFLKRLFDPEAVGPWVAECTEAEPWKGFLESPRAKTIPASMLDRHRMKHAMGRLQHMLNVEPLCMVHGDEHLGNLFLEADGRPGLLDWCTRKSLWHMSVGYFLGSALDVDNRRKWEKPLLSYYLTRLAEYSGRDAMDFDQAWLSYRRGLVWGYFVWLTNPDGCQPPLTNVVVANRFAMAVLDNRTFDLLES